MSTKADLLKRIASLSEDSIIAVPVLWTKESAQDAYNYMNDEESLELTDEQWAEVVEEYENAEFYGDEDMVQIIEEVVEKSK